MKGYAYATYLQDDWRVNGKLTLNIGFRYDYAPPLVNQLGSGTFVFATGSMCGIRKIRSPGKQRIFARA